MNQVVVVGGMGKREGAMNIRAVCVVFATAIAGFCVQLGRAGMLQYMTEYRGSSGRFACVLSGTAGRSAN